MYTILIVGVLLVIVSLLSRQKYSPAIGFFFVFLIMGFESGIEGDFGGYMDDYNYISQTGIVDSRTMESEPVLPLLMRFFSFLGPFWFFIVVRSLFQCYILTRFVKLYAPKRFQYISAVLFYFTFNLMLLQMHAIRQGLAVEIVLLSFMLVDSRKTRPLSILIFALAYFTHNSVLVILPFFFLYYLFALKPNLFHGSDKDRAFIFPIVLVIVYFFVYIIKVTFLNQYLAPLMLLGGEENRFAGYIEGNNTGELLESNMFEISPLIVIYDAIIVFIVSWYYKIANPRMKVFALLSIATAFGDMLFFGVGTFARIIMYYAVFNIIVYPAITLELNKKYGRIAVLIFLVLLIGYAVKTSLPWIEGTDRQQFGNYHFIFLQ